MAYQATHARNAQIWFDGSTAGTFASSGTANLVQLNGKASWSSDNNRDFVDTTSFQDSSKTSVAGLANASVDVSGNWDFIGSGSLVKNFTNSTTERAFLLYPDITNYPTWFMSGKAFASQKSAGSVTTAVTLDLHIQAGPSGLTWTTP